MASTPVLVETTATRCIASALDWPGWARSGKTVEAAVAALDDYAERYAVIMRLAEIRFATRQSPDVVEILPGTTTTTFGAPDVAATLDERPVTATQADTHRRLLAASWTRLDELAVTAPESLRKGPRGGGRDRDAVVRHVREAQKAYAGKIGLRPPWPREDDLDGHAALRDRVLHVTGTPSDGKPVAPATWLPRYAARRIVWHVLDHVWEIEDRSA